jgi:lipopolysaccharide export system protein LptA
MMRLLSTMFALMLCGFAGASAQSRPSPGSESQNAKPPAAQAAPSRPSGLGDLGANNKEPIKIEADRLDVFDKEQRAVYKGNVVAVQGESTMRCAELTILYEQRRAQGVKPAPAAAGQGDGAIRRIDCRGPVTIVSRTQTATGDNAVFDRTANRILLTGNVALSDGPNVTTGERIVYDLNTSIANVETNPGGRVRGLFVPGSNPEIGGSGGTSGPAKPQGRPPQTN